MTRFGNVLMGLLLRGVSDRALREDLRAMLLARVSTAQGQGSVAAFGIWIKELAGLAQFVMFRPLRGTGAGTEAFLSLVPGHVGVRPAEPEGQMRQRAERQLARYPELRELSWQERWSVWSRAWPAIAADRSIRRLRWIPLACVMAAPFVVLPWLIPIGQSLASRGGLGVALYLVALPIAIGLTVLAVGAPVALVCGRLLRNRIRPYLAQARFGTEKRTAS